MKLQVIIDWRKLSFAGGQYKTTTNLPTISHLLLYRTYFHSDPDCVASPSVCLAPARDKAWKARPNGCGHGTRESPSGCGSKIGTPNETLVNGNFHCKLRSDSWWCDFDPHPTLEGRCHSYRV